MLRPILSPRVVTLAFGFVDMGGEAEAGKGNVARGLCLASM
ncbi:MAG TPA: hypothetical protein PLX53_07975 [Tenuifilaceae bacterium]|nr:hypothetical protein [Tenuifilaceae bacterium]